MKKARTSLVLLPLLCVGLSFYSAAAVGVAKSSSGKPLRYAPVSMTALSMSGERNANTEKASVSEPMSVVMLGTLLIGCSALLRRTIAVSK